MHTLPVADVIRIYTDGSCHAVRRVGAWVAILFNGDEKIMLKGDERETTHQRMELTAVIEALTYCNAHGLAERPVHIFTDSQYVVNIEETREKIKAKNFVTKKGMPVRNEDLVRALIGRVESGEVVFTKVKAHRRSEQAVCFNREADKLARKIVRELVNR